MTWKPTEAYRHWVRASTGYGIPGFGNVLRDPVTGQPGTNFNLKPQKNLNFEIGTESKLTETLTVQLVGFWTFFKDELISRAVSGTNVATVNADSSQYRGIEAFYDWRPMTGLRLSGAYTHIEAKYTNFSDQINTASGLLVRDGKNVPNVPTDVLNSKVAYDHWPTGWGAWVDNIADKKYAASGQVIGGETAGAAAGQSVFFAGYGRAFYGGVTLGLF